MNTRAQGISVNVIIIAAIALVVMVILIALVLNTGSDINTTVTSCEAQEGAVCETSGSCQDGFTRLPSRGCPADQYPEGTVCCIPLS